MLLCCSRHILVFVGVKSALSRRDLVSARPRPDVLSKACWIVGRFGSHSSAEFDFFFGLAHGMKTAGWCVPGGSVFCGGERVRRGRAQRYPTCFFCLKESVTPLRRGGL